MPSKNSEKAGKILELFGDSQGNRINTNKIIIAGPCAVESIEQMETIGNFIEKSGVDILRGGAFKPRTSPKSFQGLGREGIKILSDIGKKYNTPVVTEVMDSDDLDFISQHCDVLQIGSRNMYNYSLLKKVGSVDKPVILKRGMSATIDEWIKAAEYISSSGNNKIIFCERGIRTFEPSTRNTLDLSSILILKKKTGLPVIVDPSHATGIPYLITPMSKAALVCGADGLMIEIHPEPNKALCDGEQSLNFNDFVELKEEIKAFI